MLGENIVFCLLESVCVQLFIYKLNDERDVKKLLMTDGKKAQVMGHPHPTCSTESFHLDGNSLDLLPGLNITFPQEH